MSYSRSHCCQDIHGLILTQTHKQGGVLSPVLVVVYIDGLLKWLSKMEWDAIWETSLWVLCHLLMILNC